MEKIGENSEINYESYECTYNNCESLHSLKDLDNFNAGLNTGLNTIYIFLLLFVALSLGYKIVIEYNPNLLIFDEFLKTLNDNNLYDLFNNVFYNVDLILDKDLDTDLDKDLDTELDLLKDKKVINFEDKYLDQYAMLEKPELSKDFLEGLKNNFVMEHTPVGNVIMCYDVKRESFSYYADNVIPYRFLEVLGRKYVCTFMCAKLYNSMEDELKRLDDKKQKDELEIKMKEEAEDEAKAELAKINANNANGKDELINTEIVKKSVYAKLKDYNKNVSKESMSVKVDAQKNASRANTSTAYLKENANRYSCDGKINNMQFLKKVERKVTDKNYAMSFADFKKMKALKEN